MRERESPNAMSLRCRFCPTCLCVRACGGGATPQLTEDRLRALISRLPEKAAAVTGAVPVDVMATAMAASVCVAGAAGSAIAPGAGLAAMDAPAPAATDA